MALTYLAAGAVDLQAANWSDTIGIAGGATCVIDAPFGNSQTINTNIDWSGTAAVSTFDIQRTFSGNIGSSSGSFKIGATTRYQNNASGGIHYLAAAATGGAGNVIARYIHSGTSTGILTGGTFTLVEQSAGVLNVGTSTVVTTVNHSGGDATYEPNGTAITTLTISGGTIRLKRGATTIVNYGGRLIYDNTVNCTTFSSGPGSYTDWRGGNIATGNMVGGYFTVAQMTRAATIGSTAFNVWAAASVQRNTQGGQVATFSNENPVAGGPMTSSPG